VIDVQIVAGKRHDVLQECLGRLMSQDGHVRHIYIANNTGSPLDIPNPLVTVVNNRHPLTFEQNHNALARLGDADYILFIDDDAFIFPGCLETLFRKLSAERDALQVSGVNNQTLRLEHPVREIPKVAKLDEFRAMSSLLEELSRIQLDREAGIWNTRIFSPGSLVLTRRETWMNAYGGWDERYANWNEEVDYILWGYEHGFKTLVTPSVWYFHCLSTSRAGDQLLGNILSGSRHFLDKFPPERLSALRERLSRMGGSLAADLDGFAGFNRYCSVAENVRASDYYSKILKYLD